MRARSPRVQFVNSSFLSNVCLILCAHRLTSSIEVSARVSASKFRQDYYLLESRTQANTSECLWLHTASYSPPVREDCCVFSVKSLTDALEHTKRPKMDENAPLGAGNFSTYGVLGERRHVLVVRAV